MAFKVNKIIGYAKSAVVFPSQIYEVVIQSVKMLQKMSQPNIC